VSRRKLPPSKARTIDPPNEFQSRGWLDWLHFDAEVEQLEGAVLDGGELRIEGEARVQGAVHGHDISGHCGEVGEEGAEAVDWQAIAGRPSVVAKAERSEAAQRKARNRCTDEMAERMYLSLAHMAGFMEIHSAQSEVCRELRVSHHVAGGARRQSHMRGRVCVQWRRAVPSQWE
jgi:hypothetical protein